MPPQTKHKNSSCKTKNANFTIYRVLGNANFTTADVYKKFLQLCVEGP